jgi:hypothetical protein
VAPAAANQALLGYFELPTLIYFNRDIDTSQYWLAFDCVAGHVRLEDWDNLSALRYRRPTPHAVRLVHERFQRAGCQQEWLQSELSRAEVIGELLYEQIQHKAAERRGADLHHKSWRPT